MGASHSAAPSPPPEWPQTGEGGREHSGEGEREGAGGREGEGGREGGREEEEN